LVRLVVGRRRTPLLTPEPRLRRPTSPGGLLVFVFLLQVRHAVADGGPLYLFAVFSAIVWVLWILKVLLSRRYRPWTAPYLTSTSVIVPVVDEPADLFHDVLARIVGQRPDEIIVVINGPRNIALERVCAYLAPAVQWTWTPVAGKRNAVRVGTELARGDIVVLVDSDTIWTPGTLSELVKPFADRRVGGVTTRQRILKPERRLMTRWADWLENTRGLYSMPAQSVLGQIGCLPGRTIAFRRSILVEVMTQFLSERFLGVFLEVSDDRTLTNLTLRHGYRCVYQSTSLVYTDAPLTWKKMFKQQLRWSRGSQYNTLRMLPWMLGHAPLLAIFFLADIVLPFLLLGAVMGWAYRAYTGTGVNFYAAILQSYGMQGGVVRIVALAVTASLLSMGVRQLRHLHERPADFLRLPVFILISTLFLMPIRLIGFFRMAHASGWGTRANAYSAEQEEDGTAAADQTVEIRPQRSGPGRAEPSAPAGGRATTLTRTPVTAPVGAPVATVRRRAPMRRTPRRINLLAAIPYLIGFSIVALEVLHHA
jgi:cellulose synthase/poly-beta-1,6-N-acetylglucosamine synthase-like glycosyltransferase